MEIPFYLKPETAIPQPITGGIPFPAGKITPSDLKTLAPEIERKILLHQWKPLLFWPDGSVKWALLEFWAPAGAREGHIKTIRNIPQKPLFYHKESTKFTEIVSQNSKLTLAKDKLNTNINGILKYQWKLILPQNNKIKAKITKIEIKRRSIKTEILREGYLQITKKKKLLFWERIAFYTNNLIKIDFTIRNPHRAIHKSGFWDLGDPGSIYLKGLDFVFTFSKNSQTTPLLWHIKLKLSPEEEPFIVNQFFELYQASSGGENWYSRSHINRQGEIPLTFRGYHLKIDDSVLLAEKANPLLEMETPKCHFALAFPKFWQNFPKLLRWNSESLVGTLGLFPVEFPDVHEIQGGEQKTHTFWLYLGKEPNNLEWCFKPSRLILEPAYLAQTRTILYFTTRPNKNSFYQKLMQEALEGSNSFFRKREVIDEYGWRNFGDVYADHENAFHKGRPLISHYNNQYDLLYSFLLHFLKTKNPKWFELAEDLAKHIYDIDIYHTNEDKPAYNNGLFWHTFHYVDAFRSTHRCYSRDAKITGGGPSNEHLYSSGLLLFYLLTGDFWARHAVINFAEHVIEMDKPYPILRFLDDSPSGLATQTRDPWYHGPGRGAGNAINCLLDAHILTQEPKYLAWAEKFIRRCIHPKDDIEALGLRQPEERWSYTVFLQILGKYLLLKAEKKSFDYMFAYARSSLLHYARWMAKNEYIYLDKPDLLEYPTETWAAQELRKAEVFNLAAYFSNSGQEKNIFQEKARYFYEEGLKRLFSFKTWYFTRPMAIVLQSGFSWPWFRETKPPRWPEKEYDFGDPTKFIPQKIRVKQKLLRFLKTSLIHKLSKPQFETNNSS